MKVRGEVWERKTEGRRRGANGRKGSRGGG